MKTDYIVEVRLLHKHNGVEVVDDKERFPLCCHEENAGGHIRRVYDIVKIVLNSLKEYESIKSNKNRTFDSKVR